MLFRFRRGAEGEAALARRALYARIYRSKPAEPLKPGETAVRRKTMKAIRVHEFGDASVLRYDDIPTPEPGNGEVRLKIEAAGLNFIDTYHRMGWYPLPRPLVLGQEGAGVVDAVGAGVTEFKPGDRVAYCMQQGSYAEYA